MLLIPKSWTIPKTQYRLRDNIHLVGFTDFGGVYTHQAEPGVRREQYALGAGFGARVNLTRFVSGRVDLGFPLVRHGGLNQPGYRPQIHFGLESRLF